MEACEELSPRFLSTFEPPKKKCDHYDEQPKITKETLLKDLKDVAAEITKLGHKALGEKLNKLRRQVAGVLENQEKEIKYLRDEIQSLKEESEKQKHEIQSLKEESEKQKHEIQSLNEKSEKREEEHKKLESTLVLAQATWVWEAHLARFVVDSSKKIYPIGKFSQMNKYLKKIKNPDENRWNEIKLKLADWTEEHQEVVLTVRANRNCIAHPYLIDTDLVESEIKKNIPPESQEQIKDMLKILKMTASLMKFGRLAKFYEENKHLYPPEGVSGKGMDARALHDIISWNRNFDDINGLQSINHTEAKEYLAKYVGDSMKNHYHFIVDFIKNANSKRLGKLAWEIEGSGMFHGWSTEYGETLNQLKKLLPNPDDENVIKGLDEEVARLHVPDFLQKHLWKYGIEIVEKYFKKLRHA